MGFMILSSQLPGDGYSFFDASILRTSNLARFSRKPFHCVLIPLS
jgi:hypothetical protein